MYKFIQDFNTSHKSINMSTIVECASWSGKRYRDREDDPIIEKRPRRYYFRLESESSRASEEDTESVISLQDHETDFVRDTSDTDSKCSTEEYEVEVEYEVDSGSENSVNYVSNSSSDSETLVLAAVAGAICDSSIERWVTDCEDSDNSSLDEPSFEKTDFTTCIQCKSENKNPLYTYCEKCFQDRKKFYPPRPRKKRSRKSTPPRNPVKLDTLRSCLKGLSQDSGIGSSQECPPLDLDQIIVPDHLQQGTSSSKQQDENRVTEISEEKIESVDEQSEKSTESRVGSSLSNMEVKSRKRQLSESSLSDFELDPKRKCTENECKDKGRENNEKISDIGSDIFNSFSSTAESVDFTKTSSELCIFCNDAPKDSIFLHTNIAHRCCCYKCAKRTLHTIRRCPICNRSVNKVVKIYTS